MDFRIAMQGMARPFLRVWDQNTNAHSGRIIGTLLFVEIPSIIAAATPGKE